MFENVKLMKLINYENFSRELTLIRKPGDDDHLTDLFSKSNINIILKFTNSPGPFENTDNDIAFVELSKDSVIIWPNINPAFYNNGYGNVLFLNTFQFILWALVTSLQSILKPNDINVPDDGTGTMNVVLDNSDDLLNRDELRQFMDASQAIVKDADWGGGINYKVTFINMIRQPEDDLAAITKKSHKDTTKKNKKKKKKK